MLEGWFVGVVCAAVLASAADLLLAGSGQRYVGKLAGALLILLTVIRPVLTLGEWNQTNSIHEITKYMEADEVWAGEGTGDIMQRLMEEQVYAHMNEKLEQMHISADIQVECAPVEGDLWVPDRIKIIGDLTAAEKRELEEYVEHDLGIGRERQVYEKGDGSEDSAA